MRKVGPNAINSRASTKFSSYCCLCMNCVYMTSPLIYSQITTLVETEAEVIETIVDESLENDIETINNISTYPQPMYSLKVKCKMQNPNK